MRFHVISLPHTQTTKDFVSCAYTQKVVKFSKMMTDLGHEVFLYSSDDNDAVCSEHISVISKKEQEQYFKADTSKDFYPIEWDSNLPYWKIMNSRAIVEIEKRKKKQDFICIIAGWCQKPIADAFSDLISVEFGVGYRGICLKHRVFESEAWRHYVYGKDKIDDGLFYDEVIPNYYDISEFPYNEKQDYFVYMGRLVRRKGVELASQVCQKMNLKLKIAGQGVIEYEPGKRLVTKEFTITGDHFEFLGTVDVKGRAELLSKAQAVFYPTYYIGPFEGVAVEANLCGTPSITTPWGAFSETIKDGFNGFKCGTFSEFCLATEKVKKLDYKAIRKDAISKYSLGVVAKKYEKYFKKLLTLWGEGFYTL